MTKRCKILIIDDRMTHRMAMADGLEDFGYQVRVAADSTEAIRILQEFTPDILIIDIVMRGNFAAGFEFVETLSREYPDIASRPRIFVTAYHVPGLDYRGTSTKNNIILAKPFSFDSLLEKIRLLLAEWEHSPNE